MLSREDHILISRARQLVARLEVSDLAFLATPHENIYKKRGRGAAPPKRKGGEAPVEYDAVELLVDLQALLKHKRRVIQPDGSVVVHVLTPNPEEILPVYLRLRALVGG